MEAIRNKVEATIINVNNKWRNSERAWGRMSSLSLSMQSALHTNAVGTGRTMGVLPSTVILLSPLSRGGVRLDRQQLMETKGGLICLMELLTRN
jgi:hypothetical protein